MNIGTMPEYRHRNFARSLREANLHHLEWETRLPRSRSWLEIILRGAVIAAASALMLGTLVRFA